MSIYRRSDRVPLNDLSVVTEQRLSVVPSSASEFAVVPSSANEDWTTRRSAVPANGLLKPTVAWAAALPEETRPNALLSRFPRIANLMAILWRDPNSLRGYIDELLVDKRGNRQGFPLDVLREIFALRAHYDEVNPPNLRPWEVMNKDE